MAKADLSTPPRLRAGLIVVILLIHVAVVLGLIRAFAPDFTAAVIDDMASALRVTITTPTPTPTPDPPAPAEPEPAGAAAAPGKKAKPKETTAQRPKIIVSETPAPRVSSTGNETRSGAREAGDGTGASGTGAGTGAGGTGSGTGGGGGVKVEKIAGEINSARDYPRAGRDARLNDHVVIALTVGTNGRARGCRIVRPSRDPQADQITCDLAMKRFRFRPARNAAGEPVEAVYGWKQRWFYAGRR